MSLYVKYPTLSKTCRNKKSNGAASVYITPPNSSLSSSSGSLSSSSSERKRTQHSRGKTRRYKGHRMLIVPLPKRKKLKTMKKTNSSSSTTSGNESDVSLERQSSDESKVETPDSENYDEWVFSSCKEFCYSKTNKIYPKYLTMFTLCVIYFTKRICSVDVFVIFAMTYSYLYSNFSLLLFICLLTQQCRGLAWTSEAL